MPVATLLKSPHPNLCNSLCSSAFRSSSYFFSLSSCSRWCSSSNTLLSDHETPPGPVAVVVATAETASAVAERSKNPDEALLIQVHRSGNGLGRGLCPWYRTPCHRKASCSNQIESNMTIQGIFFDSEERAVANLSLAYLDERPLSTYAYAYAKSMSWLSGNEWTECWRSRANTAFDKHGMVRSSSFCLWLFLRWSLGHRRPGRLHLWSCRRLHWRWLRRRHHRGRRCLLHRLRLHRRLHRRLCRRLHRRLGRRLWRRLHLRLRQHFRLGRWRRHFHQRRSVPLRQRRPLGWHHHRCGHDTGRRWHMHGKRCRWGHLCRHRHRVRWHRDWRRRHGRFWRPVLDISAEVKAIRRLKPRN